MKKNIDSKYVKYYTDVLSISIKFIRITHMKSSFTTTFHKSTIEPPLNICRCVSRSGVMVAPFQTNHTIDWRLTYGLSGKFVVLWKIWIWMHISIHFRMFCSTMKTKVGWFIVYYYIIPVDIVWVFFYKYVYAWFA